MNKALMAICLLFIFSASIIGMMNFDLDETGFFIEPYQILGGDYTIEYLKKGEYVNAFKCIAKSYYYYWTYRPLRTPVISTRHQEMFREEKERFYDQISQKRNPIVPFPDRIRHGAGKPLLSGVLTIPNLIIIQAMGIGERINGDYQLKYNYHPAFIVTRLTQIIAGLISIILLYRILLMLHVDNKKALLGTLMFAIFPTNIYWLPNLHHDPFMVPFALGFLYMYKKEKIIIAGVLLGFAFAAKNVAVFLLAAFCLALFSSIADKNAFDFKAVKAIVIRIIQVCAPAFLVLVLFANPLSYARELLTPLGFLEKTSGAARAVDQQLTSGGMLRDEVYYLKLAQGDERVMRRPEVVLLDNSGMFMTFFLFYILAVGFMKSHIKEELSVGISFYLLLLIPIFQIPFGHELAYRSLLFIPFFIILLCYFFETNYLKIIAVVLAVASIIILLDPISAGTLHHLAPGSNITTLFGAIFH